MIRYVPIVVVLPADDYQTLVDALALVELPAEVRDLVAANGWTHEQVMLGGILGLHAKAERTNPGCHQFKY